MIDEPEHEEIDEPEQLPDHRFDIKRGVWKTGVKKGQEKVSLIIHRYLTFRQRREVKGHVTMLHLVVILVRPKIHLSLS